MRRYRVAIVEPATVVAEGVAAMLSAMAEVELATTYRSVTELASAMRSDDIDVAVVSTSLYQAVSNNTELGQMPIIGLQTSLADADTLRSFNAVATIYIQSHELMTLIRDAVEGPSERSHNDSHELSERECDVLILVAKGLTNKEIASTLNISPHTVISHRKNIVHKTGIRSVAGLTVYAVLNKLIDSEQL